MIRPSHLKPAGDVFNRESISDLLFERVQMLPLQLGQQQFEKLLDYLALLHKWNSVYNLTAVREPEAMVTQHLLDSLAVVPAFHGAKNVLDVGSGGGLPGIVLALALPEMHISLIDTVQKKTAFLSQVKAELKLSNVSVHTGRVESLRDVELFDVITSRAFASLVDMVNLSGHLVAPGGQFIAMKGMVPQDEIEELPDEWVVKEIRAIKVPGMKAERHLVFIQRNEV
jgi:16S rRNA (guanine527-N7)-methyltransferase